MLFDLANDPGEYHNIADQPPALDQSLYDDLMNYLNANAGGRIRWTTEPATCRPLTRRLPNTITALRAGLLLAPRQSRTKCPR